MLFPPTAARSGRADGCILIGMPPLVFSYLFEGAPVESGEDPQGGLKHRGDVARKPST